MSVRKIQYSLEFLLEANLLTQEKREGRTNVYRLTPPEQWVDREKLHEIRARLSKKPKASTEKIDD
jgi:predicted MarR family transcription regulator